MVKARLTALTEGWVSGKTTKQNSDKTESRQHVGEKMKLTVYVSREVSRLLWHTRVETGKSISSTVENLILKHLGKAAH